MKSWHYVSGAALMALSLGSVSVQAESGSVKDRINQLYETVYCNAQLDGEALRQAIRLC